MAQTQIQGQQLKDLTVNTADIADNAVTLAKLAQVATATFLGRNTAGTGDVESLSISTVKTMLSISGLVMDANMEIDPTGALSGQFLKYNGTKWIPDSVTASAAGSNTYVQFNDGGSLGGDSGLTFDKTNNSLYVAGYSAIGNNASLSSTTGLTLYHIMNTGIIHGLNALAGVDGATTSLISIKSTPTTLNGSYTVGAAYDFYAATPIKGTGVTLSNAYGLYIEDINTGNTNYAIHTWSGQVYLGDVTDSTSTSTGGVISAGGVGIAKNLAVGGIASLGAVSPTSGIGLYIGNSFAGATNIYAINLAPQVTSATTNFYGTLSQPGVAGAGSYTVGTVYNMYLATPNMINASATVTNAYGLYIQNVNVGGTLNYAIYTNTGIVRLGDATDSTSSTTGGVIMSGGLGIAKALTVATTLAVGTTPLTDRGARIIFTGNSSGGTVNGTTSVASVNGTTTNAFGLYGRVDTTASSFTLSNAMAIYAENPTKGSGSTITTAYGFYAASITSGATNYAIFTNGGQVSLGDTTDSTSSTTGAIITSGGMGIAKALTVGTIIGAGIAPTSTVGVLVSNGTIAVQGRVNDAGTTNTPNVFQLVHETSGTPAAGFGVQIGMYAETTTSLDIVMATDVTSWVVATHASRTARRVFNINDSGAAREGLRIEASGTAPLIGFLGAAAVARQTIGAAAPAGGTGATAGAYDTAAHRDSMITLLNNIRTALINLGLCQN